MKQTVQEYDCAIKQIDETLKTLQKQRQDLIDERANFISLYGETRYLKHHRMNAYIKINSITSDSMVHCDLYNFYPDKGTIEILNDRIFYLEALNPFSSITESELMSALHDALNVLAQRIVPNIHVALLSNSNVEIETMEAKSVISAKAEPISEEVIGSIYG